MHRNLISNSCELGHELFPLIGFFRLLHNYKRQRHILIGHEKRCMEFYGNLLSPPHPP